MNVTKICDDGALLLAYTAGTLDETDAVRVTQHVAQCAICREMVRENEELVRIYRTARSRESLHPSPEALSLLAEGHLGTPQLAEARSHVETCKECLEIVSVLERVDGDLGRPASSNELERDGRGPTRVGTFWSRFRPWLASPVPAYVLIVLLLYPAYLGIHGLGRTSHRVQELESPMLLSPPLALDLGRERGAEEPRIELGWTGGNQVVTFFVPIAAQRFRYRIELSRRGKTVFRNEDAQSFDGIGTFALYIPEGGLAPGDYRLRVEEVDRGSGEVANVIEFELVLAH